MSWLLDTVRWICVIGPLLFAFPKLLPDCTISNVVLVPGGLFREVSCVLLCLPQVSMFLFQITSQSLVFWDIIFSTQTYSSFSGLVIHLPSNIS